MMPIILTVDTFHLTQNIFADVKLIEMCISMCMIHMLARYRKLLDFL